MLNNKGFDLWADGYDKTVGISDEENIYPFAGYKKVLGLILQTIMGVENAVVLDIGFGTGTLTTKLYERGCSIYGQDFSSRMIFDSGKSKSIDPLSLRLFLNMSASSFIVKNMSHKSS